MKKVLGGLGVSPIAKHAMTLHREDPQKHADFCAAGLAQKLPQHGADEEGLREHDH